MICLHHSDLDGNASAAIVYRKFPECRFRSVNYDKPIPFNEIEKEEMVIIVDFSLGEIDGWDKLLSITKDVIWIDHHDSAIKNSPEKAHNLKGIRSRDACGAALTWNYFYTLERGEPMPVAIDLVDRWDRWIHDGDPKVIWFKFGMDTIQYSPTSDIWPDLLDDKSQFDAIYMVMERGKIAKAFDDQEKKYMSFHDINWEGMNFIACNTQKQGSSLFEGRYEEYDGGIAYHFDGKLWLVGIYSANKKVNHIAEKYGGGGHETACGFHSKTLPWAE